MTYSRSYLKSLKMIVAMVRLTWFLLGCIVCSGKSTDNCLSTLYFVLLSTAYVFGSVLCGASVAVLFLAISCQRQGRLSHWSFLWCFPTWALSALLSSLPLNAFPLLHYNTILTEDDNGINWFPSMFVFMMSILQSASIQAEALSVCFSFFSV